MWRFIFAVASTLHCLGGCLAIVNPNQQSANIVIYMQQMSDLRPHTWMAGVECLAQYANIFFQRREHLTRSYNMVLTSAVNLSRPAAQIQDGFLRYMHDGIKRKESTSKNTFQLRVVSDARPYIRYSVNHRGLLLADYYVIVVDSVELLRRLMQDYVSHMNSWNAGARFLVLYHNAGRLHLEDDVAESIFSEMRRNFYVHGVGLLTAIGPTDYSFMIMDYFSQNTCRSMRLRSIGDCYGGTLEPGFAMVSALMTHYFRSVSLKNCTLFMCASIAAPFVEADCVTGIELRLIGFIKARLGFHINQTCDVESRGVVDESGNWNGLLQKLQNRQCDFILGGYYPDNDVIGGFWGSDCYLYDSHTWFVKLAELRPAWRALYSIFQDETWYCFIVVLLITWFFWYFFMNMLPEPSAHTDLSVTGINSLAVSICVSVNERPICASSRIFFLLLAIYGLNVVSTYTSKLISVFSNPGYLHQIDTLDEVVEAGIPFGGLEESRDWFENEDDWWIFESYNDSEFFEPISENLYAVKRGQRVILSSRMFILQHRISDTIFAFPRNVFSSSLQMIMKPGFPFMYEFNWIIRYMRDMGFFVKINDDFVYNNTYLNRIAKMRPEFPEPNIVLTTDHLQGPFAVLVVGVCTSCVLFLGELLVYWWLAPFLSRRFGWDLGKEQKLSRQVKQKQIARERKKAKLKRNALKKLGMGDVVVYNVNDMHRGSIRFTPIKRRRIVRK